MNFYSWVFDRRLGDYKSPLDFFELGTSFREVAAGGHARSQVVDLPIDTFIGLAEPIPPDDSKRHKNLRKLMASEDEAEVMEAAQPLTFSESYRQVKG